MDLLAAVPFGLMGSGKIQGVLRLLRVLKLFRMRRFLWRLERVAELNPAVTRLVGLFCINFCAWHYIACFYWYVHGTGASTGTVVRE